MKKLLEWLVVGCVVCGAYAFIRPYFPTANPAIIEPLQPAERKPEQGEPLIALRGPLADYMQQHPASEVPVQPAAPHGPFPGDRIVDSPAGTSLDFLRKTFALKSTAKFAFEIPAHASNPQLRGSYQSFVKQEGSESSDESPDVEFLLIREPEYAALLSGRPVNVLFFVESSHSQQVQVDLAATFDRPARYCLVFRNHSGGEAKKIVHAEFRVDL